MNKDTQVSTSKVAFCLGFFLNQLEAIYIIREEVPQFRKYIHQIFYRWVCRVFLWLVLMNEGPAY